MTKLYTNIDDQYFLISAITFIAPITQREASYYEFRIRCDGENYTFGTFRGRTSKYELEEMYEQLITDIAAYQESL